MPIRTLIIDDVPTSARVLKTMYELYEDVEVVGMVESIQAAAEFIQNHEIDLASVDISLPDGDGLQLVRAIRKRFPLSFITVCTIDENDENKALANHNGADFFIGKPLSTEQIDALMEAYRHRKKAQEESQASASPLNEREWLWMHKPAKQS